ncbi:type II secretion system F family protein [Candidatus Saganbacteria bacterium]|nr:type II secretion system F family protein [Candidatus Saganbacteria bacterium]
MNTQQVSRFCHQLQMLLASGVPLWEACQILNRLSSSKLDKALQDLAHGEALSVAFNKVLPPLVISSLQNAEQVGNLEAVLKRLGDYYEQRSETEHKVKSALIYPVFVLILSGLSLALMLLFVLPGFKDLFADLGADLPWLTQFVILNADRSVVIFPYASILLIAAGVGLFYYRRSVKGSLVIDNALLKIDFIKRSLMAEVLRNLGILLQGGVPIISALSTIAATTPNQILREKINKIKQEISNGKRLSDVLSAQWLLSDETIQMIKVGENCGHLAQMLLAAADIYEKEREYSLKKFTSLLEPILTLVVGLIVGLIVMTVFLPLVNMASKLQ